MMKRKILKELASALSLVLEWKISKKVMKKKILLI